MKLNIASSTGAQQKIEIDDEMKLRIFWDKRISQEVDVTALGENFEGYVVKITGGNDKDGFPMKQGVLTTGRVRLLLDGGSGCFRPLRSGQRRRKSVRGCICASDLSVINCIIVKKGKNEIPGLTDVSVPRRLGPKRASKIRRLFNYTKKDDVCGQVIRREVKKGDKIRSKAPKIQRLVTPETLRRKRHRLNVKKRRWVKAKEAQSAYAKLMSARHKEQKEKRLAEVNRKRGIKSSSKSKTKK